MDLIPSFSVDHTRIIPGIFTSRQDRVGGGIVTTYDIRLKRPNVEPAVDVSAMHSLEHLIATFLRNDPDWKDDVIYWGPMGCLTGFYIIVKGRPAAADMYPVILEAFRYMRDFEGEVPGATPVNCGNYLLHDLPMAKWEAARYVEILKTRACYEYGKTKRIGTKGGVFFDA
jgi:S-ribosylhomocysteine lyase